MARIYHLALAEDWDAARERGSYTTSTRGRTLAEEGFIHASSAEQVVAVYERFYGDAGSLVLLEIDPDLVGSAIVDEAPHPDATETFPHIYGPLPVSAVVATRPYP